MNFIFSKWRTIWRLWEFYPFYPEFLREISNMMFMSLKLLSPLCLKKFWKISMWLWLRNENSHANRTTFRCLWFWIHASGIQILFLKLFLCMLFHLFFDAAAKNGYCDRPTQNSEIWNINFCQKHSGLVNAVSCLKFVF